MPDNMYSGLARGLAQGKQMTMQKQEAAQREEMFKLQKKKAEADFKLQEAEMKRKQEADERKKLENKAAGFGMEDLRGKRLPAFGGGRGNPPPMGAGVGQPGMSPGRAGPTEMVQAMARKRQNLNMSAEESFFAGGEPQKKAREFYGIKNRQSQKAASTAEQDVQAMMKVVNPKGEYPDHVARVMARQKMYEQKASFNTKTQKLDAAMEPYMPSDRMTHMRTARGPGGKASKWAWDRFYRDVKALEATGLSGPEMFQKMRATYGAPPAEIKKFHSDNEFPGSTLMEQSKAGEKKKQSILTR